MVRMQLRTFVLWYLMENGMNSGVSIKQHNPFPRTRSLCLDELTPQSTAWYQKQEITFSDVLAYVRRHIWENKYNKSMNNSGYVLFHINEWESLLDQLAAVT